jgi:hypothetical protein
MKTHPQHAEIIAAIKALPLYSDPQNLFESELYECYDDADLIESFGWEGEKALTPAQAVKAVKALCALRQDVFGWIIEEGEKEKMTDEESLRDFIERSENWHG